MVLSWVSLIGKVSQFHRLTFIADIVQPPPWTCIWCHRGGSHLSSGSRILAGKFVRCRSHGGGRSQFELVALISGPRGLGLKAVSLDSRCAHQCDSLLHGLFHRIHLLRELSCPGDFQWSGGVYVFLLDHGWRHRPAGS